MATNLSSTTFANTYKDDYKDSDNYYRILFNSGKALQARELTQLQTIIQSEIGRFARNIFKEGSVVSTGDPTLNNKYAYIRLVSGVADGDLPAVGQTWYDTTDNVKFKILRTATQTDTGDRATLYVQYIYTKDATAGATSIVVANGRTITNGTDLLTVASSSATGYGTLFSVPKGEFFTKEHFVFVESQSILLSYYSDTPTADVGFKITEDIVTVADTDALYDNQGSTPNTASPGADRYRIRLTLIDKSDVQSDENFILLCRVVDGKITWKADAKKSYNTINEVLAQRTKEESGNYTVRAFRANFKEKDSDELTLTVEPGVAYVEGYRLETGLTNIDVNRSQITQQVTGKSVVPQYGNFVVADSANASYGLPPIQNFAPVNLYDSINGTGNIIGSARVRAAQRYGTDIRYYLFDVQMNSGKNFTAVESFGGGPTDFVTIKLENGVAVLQETGNNSLLFPLPAPRPTNTGVTVLTSTGLKVQRRYTFTTSSTTHSLDALKASDGANWGGSALTFTDAGDWILSKVDGTPTAPTINSGLGTGTVIIGGLTTSTAYVLYAYVHVSNPVQKNKTLTAASKSFSAFNGGADSDGTLNWLELNHSDVFKVNWVKLDDSNGRDITTSFIFDNGQRDNFYKFGRLIQKEGLSIPTNRTIVTNYEYFEHGTGHFFSANSYGGINYTLIPSHTKNNGETISLRDVLDFRPAFDSSGGFTETNDVVTLLPENTDNIGVTTTHYLSRKDKLVVRRNETDLKAPTAEVTYIEGQPSFNPVEPLAPVGSMTLYKYELNPYTLSESDLSVEYINNKGYTMRDIGKLEKRIDILEELTTLNLLEVNTASLLVVDSAGNPRTKSGFLADNFTSQDFSEINTPRYRASIDQAENTLNPPFVSKEIRLTFDSSNSNYSNANVQRTGDVVTLQYTNKNIVNQNLATETINVNPFAVIGNEGYLTLSPTSDNWVETRYRQDNIIDGGVRSNLNADQLRQALRNGWTGSNGQFVITGDRVIRETVGDTVVDVQTVPWMRSKKIAFKAVNVRPDTQYFPYFNGVAVDNWVNDDSFELNRISAQTTTYGNRYANATAHPDGSTILTSNSQGVVEGTFFIPSTNSLKFRTGAAEFKLLDVTGGSDDNAASIARATFTSAGVINTRQKTVRATRQVTGSQVWFDPIAQSFLVDAGEYPSGMFLTQAGVFFSSIDSDVPVTLQIVAMENGIPTQNVLNEASVTKIPTNFINSTDLSTIQSNEEVFTFLEPVYLEPGREYAMVLLAESTKYNVYVAKTYDYVIGTTSKRVNRQPTLGSFFASQNSSTWTPDQTRDMMFKLYRASFNTNAQAAYLENADMPYELLRPNPLRFDSGDSDVTFSFNGHGFALNDKVRVILPSDFDDSIAGIVDSAIGGDSDNSLHGIKVITGVDWTGFKIGAGSTKAGNVTASSSLITGGEGIVVEQQAHFDEFIPLIDTLQPDGTSIISQAQFTSTSSYGDGRNTSPVRSKTSTFVSPQSSSNRSQHITLNEVNYRDEPAVILTSTNEAVELGGTKKSATIRMTLYSNDSAVSPVIDLQRSSLIVTENVIDQQDSATASNAPLHYVAETHPSAGTIAARHLTKQITLQEPAVGLKVLLSANRPSDANIEVYFKTGTGDDVLDDKAWTQVSATTILPADDDRKTYREYEYLAGGNNGTLASFTTYQIKIVMTSTNSSRSPKIKDLRVIALAT